MYRTVRIYDMEYYIGQQGSFGKTISESDIYCFAGICGDFNPIHTNKRIAKESIWGQRIAHGLLGSSLISTVLGMYMPGPGTIYLSQTLEFKAPIFIGDTIEANAEIIELMKNRKAKIRTTILNQKNILVISGEAIVKLPE